MLRRHFIINTEFSIYNDEIWYTSYNGSIITPYNSSVFEADIVSNTYENGKGIIKFDRNITSIGYNAFFNCIFLTSITIPNSVTNIGAYTFNMCKSLTSITISSNITRIGTYAFAGCTSLTSIVIPTNVTEFGIGTFYNCINLTSITFEGTIEKWKTIVKRTDWNTHVPATVVHCTDGDIKLENS